MFPFFSKLIAALFPSQESASTQRAHKQTALSRKAAKSADRKTADREAANKLQQEIRQGREFSLAEAIGREGGSFMKGESTVPRPLRATNAIKQFIDSQLADTSSAFATTLFDWASNDIRVSRQLDTPLVALDQILESLLNEPTTFYEFARQVAIAHSTITGDRPHFQQPGEPPHPDASNTHDSITAALLKIASALEKEQIQKQPSSKRVFRG